LSYKGGMQHSTKQVSLYNSVLWYQLVPQEYRKITTIVPQESTANSNLGCGTIITSGTIAEIKDFWLRYFTSGTFI